MPRRKRTSGRGSVRERAGGSASAARLSNRIRERREELGLSQEALADLVGVSRQAIIAIEGGRQVPSTLLGLRLARALRTQVDRLFSLSAGEGLSARLAPLPDERRGAAGGKAGGGASRVVVGEVRGRWVAHRLPPDPTLAADGVLAASVSARTGIVRSFASPDLLRRNVLVAGCAPLLGALAHRVGRTYADAQATWIPATSHRALDLLEAGLVHVAGIHFARDTSGVDNLDAIRSRFPGERMLVANLTRWRQGLVVAPGNPLAIRNAAGILRGGIKVARREEGAAAHKLLTSLLAREGAESQMLSGPFAGGHVEVAQLVRCGAADVGVAIESVALAAGLGFVPLTEERFDLVAPADAAGSAPVSRLFEALADPSFRAEVAHLPGYDAELAGHVTTVEAT
jgi:molybdate-binding protein/DNA-binding XRE family transcriptional regulator